MVNEIKNLEDLKACLQNHVTVIIDFFAEWCGPCKMLAPQFEKASEDCSDVFFAKLNVDNFGELVQEYNVLSIPTLILFKNKEIVKRNMGFVDHNFIVKWVKEN